MLRQWLYFTIRAVNGEGNAGAGGNIAPLWVPHPPNMLPQPPNTFLNTTLIPPGLTTASHTYGKPNNNRFLLINRAVLIGYKIRINQKRGGKNYGIDFVYFPRKCSRKQWILYFRRLYVDQIKMSQCISILMVPLDSLEE